MPPSPTDPAMTPQNIRQAWKSGKYEQALTDLTSMLEQKAAENRKWDYALDEVRQKHREWKADRLKSQIAGKAPSRELLEEIGDWVMTMLEKLDKGKKPPRRPNPTSSRPRRPGIRDVFGKLIERITKSSRSPVESMPAPRVEIPKPSSAPPPPMPEEPMEAAAPPEPADDGDETNYEEISPAPPAQSAPPEEAMEETPAESPPPSVSPYGYAYDTCDWVDVSVFSHEVVQPGDDFLVSVFAHLAEQAEEVERIKKEADPEAVRQGGKTLATPVERQTPIQFQLQIKDWKIEEPIQSVIWLGRPTSADFIVTVPDDASGRVIGKVIVFTDKGPVGTIAFNLTIGKAPVADPTPAETNSRLFRSTYLAYESADKAVIEALHPTFQASGWEWNPTVPGPAEVDDAWKLSAVEGISKSELFVLFWSDEAEKSERVETEWQLAFRARFTDTDGLPDMIGVNVSTQAPPPPETLSFLPFLKEFTAAPPALPEAPTFTEDNETLKKLTAKYTSEGDPKVFEILMAKAAPSDINDIVFLQSQLLSLQTREKFNHISPDLASSERGKLNLSILDLVGRLL